MQYSATVSQRTLVTHPTYRNCQYLGKKGTPRKKSEAAGPLTIDEDEIMRPLPKSTRSMSSEA